MVFTGICTLYVNEKKKAPDSENMRVEGCLPQGVPSYSNGMLKRVWFQSIRFDVWIATLEVRASLCLTKHIGFYHESTVYLTPRKQVMKYIFFRILLFTFFNS